MINHKKITYIFFFSSVDERVQRKALDEYYREIGEQAKNKKRIDRCKKFARVYYPGFCVAFVIIFWFLGIKKYSEE